jgi:hypothetical protein
MSAACVVTPGRIHLTDGGVTTFDTDWRCWINTDYVKGSLSLPQRNATAGNAGYVPVNTETTVFIGNVNPASTVVTGMFRVSDGTGVQTGFYNRWQQCGGTVIGELFGRAQNARFFNGQAAINDYEILNGIVSYTFFIVGGALYMTERAVLCPYNGAPYGISNFTFAMTVPARTVDYRVFCGSFT